MGAYLLSSRCKANVTPFTDGSGILARPWHTTEGGVSPAPEPPRPRLFAKARQALSQTPHPLRRRSSRHHLSPQAYYAKGSRQQCYNKACASCHDRRHPYHDSGRHHFVTGNKLLPPTPTLAVFPRAGRDLKMQVSICAFMDDGSRSMLAGRAGRFIAAPCRGEVRKRRACCAHAGLTYERERATADRLIPLTLSCPPPDRDAGIFHQRATFKQLGLERTSRSPNSTAAAPSSARGRHLAAIPGEDGGGGHVICRPSYGGLLRCTPCLLWHCYPHSPPSGRLERVQKPELAALGVPRRRCGRCCCCWGVRGLARGANQRPRGSRG